MRHRRKRRRRRRSGRQPRDDNRRAESCPRPFCNGPQPRSWGKPGRDAKSVVPGLRPGDRRARRRWPAAAGVFWRREFVRCETVTGVVIVRSSGDDVRVSRCRPAGRGGPAAPVWVCHSACEMGRPPERGRIPLPPTSDTRPDGRCGPAGCVRGGRRWTRRLRRRPWLCCRVRDPRPDRSAVCRPDGRSQIYKFSGLVAAPGPAASA